MKKKQEGEGEKPALKQSIGGFAKQLGAAVEVRVAVDQRSTDQHAARYQRGAKPYLASMNADSGTETKNDWLKQLDPCRTVDYACGLHQGPSIQKFAQECLALNLRRG